MTGTYDIDGKPQNGKDCVRIRVVKWRSHIGALYDDWSYSCDTQLSLERCIFHIDFHCSQQFNKSEQMFRGFLLHVNGHN
jgi:hypothetical protein